MHGKDGQRQGWKGLGWKGLGWEGRVRSLVAGVAAGLAVASAVRISQAAFGRSDFLDLFAGWPVKVATRFLAERAPDWAGRADAWVAGPGRFVVALLWTSLATFLALEGLSPGRLLLDRLWPLFPPFLDRRLERPGASAIDAFATDQPFVSRAAELDALLRLAADGRPFAWMGLVGRMGMGKTRLALEAMKALRGDGWDVGLLEPGITPAMLRTHRFRRPTFILIDDFAKRDDTVAALAELCARPHRRRVRLLLTDHVSPEVPADMDEAAAAALAAARAPDLPLDLLSAEDAGLLAPDAGDTERRPLLLKLGATPWHELGRRAEQRLALADRHLGDAGRKLLALASIAGPLDVADADRLVPGATDTARLALLFEGEPRAALMRSVPALAPELLAQAVLLRWLGSQNAVADGIVAAAMRANPTSARRRLHALVRERPEAAALDGVAPDGPAATMRRLIALQPVGWAELEAQDCRTRAAALTATDITAGEAAVAADLIASIRLWPDSAAVAAAAAEGMGVLTRRAAQRLAEAAGGSGRDEGIVADLLGRLMELAVRHPAARIAYAVALRQIVHLRGTVPDWRMGRDRSSAWTGVSATLARLDALADARDSTAELRLECAIAHRLAIVCYGTVDKDRSDDGGLADWAAVQTALARLDTLADGDAATVEIRLECARGYRNAAIGYVEAATLQDSRAATPQWPALRAALARLDALADADDATPGIRLECAIGHRSTAVWHGNMVVAQDRRREMPDRSLARTTLARLDALADTAGATAELRLECAIGHRNWISDVGEVAVARHNRGEVPDWSDLRAALARLDALAGVDDTAWRIRTECAYGYKSAAVYYGTVAASRNGRTPRCDWSALNRALGRLDDLAGADDGPPAIRLSRAVAYRNAIIDHCHAVRARVAHELAPDWPSLCSILDRLDRCEPGAEAELAFHVVIGIANAEVVLRRSGSSTAAELQRRRLRRIAWNRPYQTDIQELLEQYHPRLTFLSQQAERRRQALGTAAEIRPLR